MLTWPFVMGFLLIWTGCSFISGMVEYTYLGSQAADLAVFAPLFSSSAHAASASTPGLGYWLGLPFSFVGMLWNMFTFNFAMFQSGPGELFRWFMIIVLCGTLAVGFAMWTVETVRG